MVRTSTTLGIQRIGNLWSFVCYAEAASPRITETSICAAQQLFNSSCWAVSRFSSGGILASAASKVPPTDCLGAKILPQISRNSQKLLWGMFSHRFHRSTQIVWVRRFSHRFHGIHRTSCWGYSPTDFTDQHRLFGCVDSPTDFTEFTETLAGDILPQNPRISQKLGCVVSSICDNLCNLWENILSKKFCEFSVFCGRTSPGRSSVQICFLC